MPKTDKIEKKENNRRGHPPLYKTVAELQKLIDKYLQECSKNKEIPTIAGLAYELGIDRQTVYNYEKKDEFFGAIKRARNFILCQIEKKLVNSTTQVAGSIFLAKNYGYQDKQEIEQSGKIDILINYGNSEVAK